MSFPLAKLIEAVGVLLKEHGGQAEYMRILKLLYIANRQALKNSGTLILDDRVFAMKFGPVLSTTYDILKGQNPGATEFGKFFQRENYKIRLINDPGLAKLSKFEVRTLQEVATDLAELDSWDISELTHTFPEWAQNNPGDSSKPIPIDEIIDAVGRSSDAKEIKESLELDRAVAKQSRHLGAA